MSYSRKRARDEAISQVQICRGFGDKDWEELSKRLNRDAAEPDWQHAISVFEKRMNERFFSCIAKLQEEIEPLEYNEVPDTPDPLRQPPNENATVSGFAIVALCCLLIDTLEFFRAGDKCEKCGSERSTNKTFRAFLQDRLGFKDAEAKAFVNGVRHKLVHRSETNCWVIRKDKPEDRIVDCNSKPYRLNRTRFYDALMKYFKTYINDLREGKNPELRQHFVAGMQHIVATCREIK